MELFKKSKKNFNNQILNDNKFYYIFTFFNTNPTIVDLIRLTIEDDYGLNIFKMEKKCNLLNVFLEFDFKDYIEYKAELNEFFYNEDFKFCLTAIYYNNNYFQPSFFEEEFLQEFDEFELNDELVFFIYLKILNNIAEKKKFFFLISNVILINKTLFLCNVYNTSGSI